MLARIEAIISYFYLLYKNHHNRNHKELKLTKRYSLSDFNFNLRMLKRNNRGICALLD